MRFEQMTIKLQEAFSKAQNLCSLEGYQAIECEHLLIELIRDAETITPVLLKKVGADPNSIIAKLEEIVNKFPRVSGGEKVFISKTLNEVGLKAEEIADRVGIISNGKIILVDEKENLIKKLGQKILKIELTNAIDKIPTSLSNFNLEINSDKNILTYIYDTRGENTGITSLLSEIKSLGMQLKDISTEQSSLESIFLNLVKESKNELVRS